jgi:tetratricopeptide (TPR) repeat protein
MRRATLVLVLLLPLLAAPLAVAPPALRAADSAVRAWEAPLSVPTYPLGPPEPNPMFYAGRDYQGARGRVYPYPLQDDLREEREERVYRALWLENEFVRLSVLPELGGRIFSAEDKTNGYPFFYTQHVVKPALVGMTGAWISGGVEWNVMHHHRPSSFMPVQSAIVRNPDGSRTIWVGETEWRQRMRWVVGITLREGRSVVEADVRMINRTGLPHSVLYFANPAVHANEDYEVLFPPDVAWATFHAKTEFSPWPLARGPFVGIPYAPGTNLGLWKNHERPVSFFVYHSDLDFFGGYDHGRRAGVVHVADRDVVPGKKFWTWGNGPDGRMWDGILSDADGPYIELMAGGYSDNQPDYSWIQPGEEKALTQSWYPLRELGGLQAANTRAAANVEVGEEGRVRVAVDTTSLLAEARVRLRSASAVLLDATATLAPDAPFVREVEVAPGTDTTSLSLEVVAASGETLLAWHRQPRPTTPEPSPYVPPPPPPKVKTVEELVLAGRRLEQFHNPRVEPEPYYREALRRDPGHSAAHTALGALALRRGEYALAEDHLSRAVARLTANHTRARDGEPWYLLGLARVALGREDAARGAFAAAAWDLGWTAAALLEEARLESSRGERVRALALVERALDANPRSTAALALDAALLRHAGRADLAFERATRALEVDPLDPLAARERRLAREAGAAAPASATDALEAAALASLDEDQYALEAAHEYARGGLLADATLVLEARLPSPESRADPLVAYTLGWLHERAGDRDAAARWYRRGRELPSEYCFPFRLESVDVLERAIAADPADPRAPFYLGNVLYDRQPRRAITEWEQSARLDPGFARVHRNLAFAYARVTDDLARAVASQEEAVAREKGEPRLFYELDQYLAWSRAPLATRLGFLDSSPRTVAARDITRARRARVQLLLGRADDALATLRTGRFHVWEGERGVHEVFVEACLRRGRGRLAAGDAEGALAAFREALPIPANIEVGQAVGAHLAAVHHHVGLALAALGREDEAVQAFRESAEAPVPVPEAAYWKGLSLGKLGRASEARRLFEGLAATRPAAVDPSRPLEPRMAARAREADGLYQRALGEAALGFATRARADLARAAVADPDHVGAAALREALGAPSAKPEPARRPGRPPAEAPPGTGP